MRHHKLILVTLLLALGICFYHSSYCQGQIAEDHTEIPAYYSPSSHGFLVRFIGYDVNDVIPKLELYMQNYMVLRSVESATGVKDGWYKITYEPGIQVGSATKRIYIMVKSDADNKITQMKISGNRDLVVTLFCNYWTTKLDFDQVKKQELVVERNFDERIALNTNLSVINITKQ